MQRREGQVLLVDQDGEPLLVWQEPKSYQRRTAGFVSPRAREKWDELLRRSRDERPPVVAEAGEQAEAQGVEGQGAQASED